MSGADSALSYRRVAAQQATSAGLMVILCDMLVDDLRRAIVAVRNGDIQARSGCLKHAFTILELLEGSLDHDRNQGSAQSLGRFYAFLRKQVITAQFESSDRILEQQIALILEIREAWRQADEEAGTQLRNASAAGRQEPVLIEDNMSSQWFA